MDKIKIMKKNKSGVTIIGVLIGVTILSVALISQIRLLSNTIKREADLRNIITATNLAREGIELAFAWRVASHIGWETIKEKANKGSSLCTDFRMINMEETNCANKNLEFLNLTLTDYNSYFFGYGDGMDNLSVPLYWRTIKFLTCDDPSFTDDQCLKIKVSVGWGQENETNKQISLEKRIYNWYVP